LIIIGLAASLLMSCVEKMALPNAINPNTEFMAGDTTYLLISPIWGEEQGLKTPMDISIAQNGHIYVADSMANTIFVLNQSGDVLSGFDDLKNLKTNSGAVLNPIDVDIDGKMNVVYIDGSNKVYRWNAYLSLAGIDSIAQSGKFKKIAGAETMNVAFGSTDWENLANDDEWELENVVWGFSKELIDSILEPHLFFDGGRAENIYRDAYYKSENSQFSGVSTVPNEPILYVTDVEHDRIIRINYERKYFILTGAGEEIWVHIGKYGNNVSGFGTGAGRVNIPSGIDTDYSGNIYYSQLGNFFGVSKIKPEQSGRFMNYPNVFQPDVNEIMDLNRFKNPGDIAVDRDQNVYVANSGAQEIQVFDSYGAFFKKAGIEEISIDTTLILDSVPVDTFIKVEISGFLEYPMGITVDQRGVLYICDPPTGRIVRYQLSNKLDENLQPQD